MMRKPPDSTAEINNGCQYRPHPPCHPLLSIDHTYMNTCTKLLRHLLEQQRENVWGKTDGSACPLACHHACVSAAALWPHSEPGLLSSSWEPRTSASAGTIDSHQGEECGSGQGEGGPVTPADGPDRPTDARRPAPQDIGCECVLVGRLCMWGG